MIPTAQADRTVRTAVQHVLDQDQYPPYPILVDPDQADPDRILRFILQYDSVPAILRTDQLRRTLSLAIEVIRRHADELPAVVQQLNRAIDGLAWTIRLQEARETAQAAPGTPIADDPQSGPGGRPARLLRPSGGFPPAGQYADRPINLQF